MSILLIFVDGVGVGSRGTHNPFDAIDSPYFSIFQGEAPSLPHDGRLSLTDASLGVEGLPQSATGQTAILTGINAPKLIGKHLSGFPSPRLRQALERASIYRKLKLKGRRVTFANAYTPAYFEQKPRFVSATTVAAESAGVRLRTLADLRAGEAVFHDFSNLSLRERGFDVQSLSPEEAGRNLARLARRHDFTLYEHFITDRLGHSQAFESAVAHIRELTRFVEAAISDLDLTTSSVVVASDHGNLEDLTRGTHTVNPVATLGFGKAAEMITRSVQSLTDLCAALESAVTGEDPLLNPEL